MIELCRDSLISQEREDGIDVRSGYGLQRGD